MLAARGQVPEADAGLEDAVARARRSKYVMCEAQALKWHGEMLAAHGESEQARERLEEAREIFARVGAEPYTSRVDEGLERLAT